MSQVGTASRFWWRVADARVAAASTPSAKPALSQAAFAATPTSRSVGSGLAVPARRRIAGCKRPGSTGLLAHVRPAPTAVAALLGIACFAAFSDVGRSMRAAVPISEHVDRLILAAGFGIEQVSLTGHRFTSDSDIYDALDLANVRSMLRFDGAIVRERMERLPWIASATITRVFPDRLEVRVTERTPFAVWHRGEREYLIDGTGRVLSAITTGSVTHLPRVAGEGAAGNAAALLSALGPDLTGRLQSAERIGERRWSLHLVGGSDIHLPAEGWREAIAKLADPAIARRISGGTAQIIDLRAPAHITIRNRENTPSQIRRGA